MTTSIKQDAIAGHKQAIASLRESIAERELNLKNAKYVSPQYLAPINHRHQWEKNRLELLELELKEIG